MHRRTANAVDGMASMRASGAGPRRPGAGTLEDRRSPVDPDAAAWERPARPRRRVPRLAGRVSGGHVVMVVAALTAVLANLAVLRGGDAGVAFVTAAHDLPTGATVTRAAVRVEQAPLPAGVAGTLLAPGDLEALEGAVTAAAVPAGGPIRTADLRDRAGDDGQRRMSVPLQRHRAVGGDVRVGDRVDVIQVFDGSARYIVAGAPVLDVLDEGSASLSGIESFAVTVAVDAATALCLAAAVEAGAVSMILSTGQEPVAVAGCGAAGTEAGR